MLGVQQVTTMTAMDKRYGKMDVDDEEIGPSLGLYPLNRSLEEEMLRLFAQPAKLRNSREIAEDFKRNGVASDYRPDDCSSSPDVFSVHRRTQGAIGETSNLNTSSSSSSSKTSSTAKKKGECVFCRNNGETRIFYQSHVVKDKLGKVTCPVLRSYRCPTCGASGDGAHTLKYCPKNRNRNMVPSVILIKSMRTCTGKWRTPMKF